MNIAFIAFAVLVIVIVLGALGCTSNLPYRTNFDATGGDPTKAVIETTPSYKLGFVEFDDQGCPWIIGKIDQRTAVENMIRAEAGIHTANPQGIILVAFVHGWKDNAAYDNFGVTAFRDILQQLSNAEGVQTDHPARKVVGVYVGWRGLSATVEPFKELSFWGRKDTAHKVGGYGAMTKLLVDLENIQKESLDALPESAPRTELIIIGHSFGGAAVYSALAQIMTDRFVNAQENHKRLKPLGDQVILLNPAFEAIRHFDLNQLAVSINQYPQDQRPVLSIFTSKGDWATHYVFPIGRFFSTLFEKNSSSEQKQMTLDAVGWYKPFVTHELVYNARALVPSTQTSTFNLTSQKHEFHNQFELLQSVKNVKEQRRKWQPNGATAQTYNFDDSILKPVDGFHPGDPFLIVSVDKQIMSDHTDIKNRVLINFIREYIQFCQIDSNDHSK